MPVVAVDATPLLGARTGIGVAVAGFLDSVRAHQGVSLVGYGFTATRASRLAGVLPAGVRACTRPMPAGALLRAWSRWDHPTIETWTGPVDVVHGTNFVVPPARRAGRLVSVWDLSMVRFPEMVTANSRRYPDLIRRAVQQGAWVHTGAASIRHEIVEELGADPARVVVVPPGLAPADPPPAPAGPPGPPYVLGLGTTEPRKDFPSLVAAFERLAAAHPDLELRIAGPAGWAETRLERAIEASPAKDRIRRLGWVGDGPALMAGAAVFAYPSVYEGFGLPPLEAMALGVPVVATSGGAVPEVVGDAAVLVAPGDPDALADGLRRVLEDTGLRDGLIDAGRRRAAAFTWAAAGEQMAATYRAVAEAGAGHP
jgi:glycosyltransferase involved in cell wall biosynthesis